MGELRTGTSYGEKPALIRLGEVRFNSKSITIHHVAELSQPTWVEAL
jgi:hypothetical protein